jgi:hypothetical protein
MSEAAKGNWRTVHYEELDGLISLLNMGRAST